MQTAPPSQALARFREAGIVVFLLFVVVAASIRAPRFLAAANLQDILLQAPLLIIAAMGMTMVILTRNIDLSVGSALGLTGMLVGLLLKQRPGFPIVGALGVGILIGCCLGALNGLLVTALNVPAIITTLGTLSAYRGLAFVVSGGRQVDPNDIPDALLRLSRSSPFGVPWIVLIALAVAVATHAILRYHRSGRALYAIGGNPAAARLSGIRVGLAVFLVFVAAGALSGLAGVLYASLYGFVNPAQTGAGFELSVIAATVIGGTDVFGGIGSVPGTVLGCLLLAVVNNALAVTGLSAQWQLAAYGLIILLGVWADSAIRARRGAAAEASAY